MLTSEQVEHYRQNGFIVMERLISLEEIAILRAEVNRMIESAPESRGAHHDRSGRPVQFPVDYSFTDLDPDGSRQVLNRISWQLAHSEVMFRAYGNPKLLEVVENLYGPDFVPFAESTVIKMPEDGAPFTWHQDGQFRTGPQPERGINLGIYLYPSNEENGCLFVIPGSQKWGQADIAGMIKEHGERLPGSDPGPVEPGDVIVHSRNLIHGSFANHSSDLRVTVYFGFHHRPSLEEFFEKKEIEKRSRIIPLAIRKRRDSGLFPDEQPYHYQPLPEAGDLESDEIDGILRATPSAI